MEKIIHYTNGYGGKLNYITICEKEIHSHSKTEDATIDPKKVNCVDCRKSKIWNEDLKDYTDFFDTQTKDEIKKRIFIESDILSESELKTVQRSVANILEQKGEKYVRRVFSNILEFAWHDLEETWESVKLADEIYASSSLIPLTGGSYTGAPVIFDGMCARAINECVTGKSVYILNEITNIMWDEIDMDLLKKAFQNNDLYTYNDEYEIVKININKL